MARPKNTAKNKKACYFFVIKIHEKLLFLILRVIGRVRICGPPPKTTLRYTDTKKTRQKKACDFFAIKNHEKSPFLFFESKAG